MSWFEAETASKHTVIFNKLVKYGILIASRPLKIRSKGRKNQMKKRLVNEIKIISPTLPPEYKPVLIDSSNFDGVLPHCNNCMADIHNDELCIKDTEENTYYCMRASCIRAILSD